MIRRSKCPTPPASPASSRSTTPPTPTPATPDKCPVILNASNLAALLNKNPYTNRGDAFLAAWKSSDKKSYYDAHNRNGVETIEHRRREIQKASPFITANIRAPKPQFMDVMSSGKVPAIFDTHADRAEFHTESSFSNTEVMKEAKRLAFTRYGTEREICIIERVRDILPEYDFHHREDEIVRREIGTTTEGFPIVLQGKVDGMSADGKTILECKTRMHKLFMKLREYEALQTTAYLELFPEATQAVLTEAYFGSNESPDINIIFIPRGGQDWKTVALGVGEALAWILSREHLQDALVKSKNKTILVQHLVTRALDAKGPPPPE